MKKILLLASVSLAFAAQAAPLSIRQVPVEAAGVTRAADTSLEFCYCGSMGIAPDTFEAGTPVSCAMYIPAQEAAKLKGNNVTAVSVFVGYDTETYANSIPTAKVWLTYDLDEAPFSESEGPLGSEMTSYYSVNLDNPYTIVGDKGFYVGYTVVCPNKKQSPVIFDFNDHDNDWGGWYRVDDGEWTNQTESYGFALIKCTLQGQSLPQNAVGVYNSNIWGFVYPGRSVENDIQFINMGAAPVKSVTLEVKTGDTAPVRGSMAVEGEILFNDLFRLYVDAVVTTQGNNVPVTVTVIEVNGQPNECADNSVTNYVLCLEQGSGFNRNVVMEQGTGLNQGGSPLGIVSNQTMGKTYGTDKSFIPVMIHMYDNLSAEGYDPFFTTYLCTSIPSIIPNRLRQFRNSRAGLEEMEYIFETVGAMPAFAKMDAKVNQDDSDPSILNITTNTSFLSDCEGEWRLSYVLRRDHVGPASQANFYSKDYEFCLGEEMGGFEHDPNPCDIYLDNVGVLNEAYDGIEGTVPKSVKAGQEYEYTYKLHVDDDTKIDSTTVLVYLINSLNGVIEQAVAVPYSDFNGVNVDNVSTNPAVEILSNDGVISVSGNYSDAEVYSIAGIKVADLSSDVNVAVASGLYIVTVDGKAHKILVK